MTPDSRFKAINLRSVAYLATAALLLACGLPAIHAQNTITTVAGGGTVNGSASGPYADIAGPSSVATDAAGNAYAAVPGAQEVFKVDTSGNLTIFAGVGYSIVNPQQFDGQPATSGSLYNPTGIAVDSTGNVYIADTADQLVRMVDTKGIMRTVAGSGTPCANSTSACGDGGQAKAAMLNSPSAVAVDTAGNIYIADSGDNRIRMVATGTNVITTVAGTGVACASPTSPCGDNKAATAAQLNDPLGVAIDKLGNLVIADSGDRRVRAIAAGKTAIIAYAGTGNLCNPQTSCGDGGKASAATFDTPWQIFVDASDNLYIADAPANRIRKVSSTQRISTVAGTGAMGFGGDGGAATSATLNIPHGIASDVNGNLYIGDTGNQRIRQVNSAAKINTLAGGGSGGDGAAATSAILAADHDVALDSAGNLYIADTINNRIRQVTPANPPGNITTVAGSGIAGYAGDGQSATVASLNSPYGLALDSSNNIYIADTFNGRIRLVNSSSGLITTFAGNGQSCNPAVGCGDGGDATQASLTLPTTVAVDNSGNVYIADQASNQIRMVNSSGIISTLAGNGTACASPTAPCGDGGPAASAQLNGPFGVAADSLGNVYIADTNDNRVRVVSGGIINAYAFTGASGYSGDGGSALAGTFASPEYLTLDPRGNLFASGSSTYFIVRRIDAPTSTLDTVAGHLGDPIQYGFGGDGGKDTSAYLHNLGVTIDNSGDLYIADGGNNRVRYVDLLPIADLGQPQVNFPPQPLGTTSAPMIFTNHNKGGDDIFITSTTITGDFAFVDNPPCANNIIAPGIKCSIGVTFTPTGYGERSGKVTINDNAYGYPAQVEFLLGYGPDFTLTANPTSLTVARGTQGTSKLTLTPSAGFNQTISLSCTGVPQGTTCGAKPGTVTLDGSDPATSTLTVVVGSNTTPGSYSLKVTGSSVTTHSVNIALTVQ